MQFFYTMFLSGVPTAVIFLLLRYYNILHGLSTCIDRYNIGYCYIRYYNHGRYQRFEHVNRKCSVIIIIV